MISHSGGKGAGKSNSAGRFHQQLRAVEGVFALLLLLGIPDRVLGVELSLTLPIPQNPPSIAIYQHTGTQSGDVTVPYVISDPEGSTVGLLAEYSTNDGGSWQAASVTGDTSDIAQADYDSSLVWLSGTDLADKEASNVRFRITPHDNGGWGTADIISINIDNMPPEWIAATGTSGDTTITFWFDEPVQDATATNTSNITLSGGLTTSLITAKKWSVGSSMSYPRRGCASAVIDGKLHVVGGDDTTTLQVYDPATDTWETKASLSETRDGAVAVEINGKLYVASGEMYDFSDVEIYDPATNSWSTGPQHNTARWAAAGAINGKLYMAGGYGWGTIDDDLMCYNPITNNWTYLATMTTARWGAASGIISGKLYVAGGEHDGTFLTALEVYDPTTDTWTVKADMPAAVGYASSGVINGRLYIAGGWNGSVFSDKLYVYNPASDTWTTESTMPSLRYEASAGVIDDRLYVAGGYYGGYIPHVDIYDPRIGYELTLTSGQTLPGSLTSVTVTASNITDYYGNTIAASLDSSFFPTATQVPSVTVYQPTGVQSGNVTVPYMISDADSNLVSLLAEYSTNDGGSWQSANVSGDTTDIAPADYDSSLVWQSGTDLADEEASNVWFRITPYDTVGWGTADTTFIDIDNLAPQWIAAAGVSGDSTITFWFNELVSDSLATNTANFSLSGGLTIESIVGVGNDEWMTKTSMPSTRRDAVAGVIDGKLYVVGGYSGGRLSTLEVYDPSTDSWTTKTSMPTARYEAAAGVIDDKLYVVGGFDGSYLSTLEVYDPSTDNWTTKTSMPTARQAVAVGVIDGKLYVAGGADGFYLSKLEVYDPSTDSWTTKTSMPSTRRAAVAEVIDGKLYLAGGDYGSYLNTLEAYDPSTDSWTAKTSMLTARRFAAAGVINGKLYVAGGYNGQELSTVEVYDPSTDTWSTKTSMPTARSGAAGVIDSKLYVAGGSDGSVGTLNTLEVYTALPSSFTLTLASGHALLIGDSPDTLTAFNTIDLYGNIAASLDTTFYPTTGDVPSITVTPLSGIYTGDIPIAFQITDTEKNPVSLTAGYSTDGGLSWSTATVTGNTTDIPYSSYQDTLIWQSRINLAGQVFDPVYFKITPSDNATSTGIPDSISFGLDNKPPEWIAATGVSGDTTITFWFDEPVGDSTATNTSNIALSGGFTAGEIRIQKWTTGSSMNTPRRGSACAVIDGKLYVMGGIGSGSNDWKKLEVYDPATDTWTVKTDMPTARSNPVAGVIDGKLYVTGNSSFDLEVYDPATNTWSDVGSGQGDSWAVSGVINGKLYMVTRQSLKIYNPITDTWTSNWNIPTSRVGAAAGVIDGKLYVAGGEDSGSYLSILEVYDPATGTWTEKASMPLPVGYAAAGVIHDRLFVAGGWDGTNFSGNLYAYDPATDSWSVVSQIPALRYETAAGVIDNKLYIVSGYYGGYTPQVDVFDPQIGYMLILDGSQILPPPDITVTVTASNISDWYGNTISAPLDTSINPIIGEAPTIALNPLDGTFSGDITVSYEISDPEGNPITLRTEYSVDGASSWQAATVTGAITGIYSPDYQDSLIWQSGTDLADQVFDGAWFRITPRDNETTDGVPDSISFGLDNKPPEWIAATGVSGDTTITFWFDEPVQDATATNTSNISLSGGLTAGEITAQKWTTGSSMNSPRRGSACAVIDGKLYVVGGTGSGSLDEKKLEVYDPATDTWTVKRDMPTARISPVAGVIDGKLYVTGNSPFYVDVYDPATNIWSNMESGKWVDWAASGVINGKLYVVTRTSIHVYDLLTSAWTSKANIPTSRIGAAAGVIDGKLYVAGGEDSGTYQAVLEVYDPVTDTWTEKASMPSPVGYTAAGVIHGRLYIAGGWDGTNFSGNLYAYDPATDSWSIESQIPTLRYETAAGVIDNKLYLVSGYNSAYVPYVEVYDPRIGYELILDSGQTLPFEQLTLQASGIQDWYGNEASSLSTVFVPDDQNSNPSIIMDGISDEVSGDVSINYDISDNEGDLMRLIPEFSTDDRSNWYRATTSPDTQNIGPSNYGGSLTWYSATDLAGLDIPTVWFRLTPSDNILEIGTSDQIEFHLDNNEVPSVTITNSTYSKTDTTWTFDYRLSDTESDTLDLIVLYTTDRITWILATTPSSITGILPSGYNGSVVWQIERDLPGANTTATFHIMPRDHDEGDSDEADVLLNALGVPLVTIDSTYTEEQSGDVTIPFTIADEEGNPVSLLAEYRDSGGTWQPAMVTGDTSALSTAEYTGTLVWNSGSDLAGRDLPNQWFRLTPYDANTGFSDEVSIQIDNNAIPSVSVGTPSGYQYRNVYIDFTLSDAEGDALGILALCSNDGGNNWNNMMVSGDTTAIVSANYSSQITWHCFDDLGYGQWTSVMVKLIPNDLDSGTEGTSGIFTIENYVGDYSANGSINSADFTTLVYAYNTQDLYHDIGPATGSVPWLTPNPDSVIDFEDLAVFIQMWNWSLGITAQAEEAAGPRVLVRATGDESQRSHLVTLEEKLSDDPWATDDGVMDLEIKANQVSDVMVASVEIDFDTEHLRFLALEPGTFIGRPGGSNQSLIYLQHVDEERGKLSLLLGRIDSEDPDVSGSGLLALLHFTKLSKENSNVTVAYELWDSKAELITQAQYTTEVNALRIPGEFALLQNYPNPFNGETIIRFQLPQATRVQMYVFNIRGQRVATLIDEQVDPGYYKITWDGRNDQNRQVASGIYIYLIQAGQHRQSKKMTILREEDQKHREYQEDKEYQEYQEY